MHEIAFSLLQRAIAASGEFKTRSEAHENDMTLTITEEEAVDEYICIVGAIRHDLTYYEVWHVLSLKTENGGILNALVISFTGCLIH